MMLAEMLCAISEGVSAIGGGGSLFSSAELSAAGPNWVQRLLFEPWPQSWAQRNYWQGVLYVSSITLGLVTAGLLIAELYLKRARVKIPKGVVVGVSIVLTLVGFLNYFGGFNPNTRYKDYYHRHEFFHYYLGSKYFEELNYGRIYECVAVAEVELGHGATLRKQEIRDLSSENLITPLLETNVFKNPKACTDHFSEPRWALFKADVKWLRQVSGGTYWVNMKKDHGYNPPPVWTMSGKLFSSLGPASDATFKWLAAIDVGLHAAILGLFAWAFGWRISAIASIFWATNAAGNFYWTGGAFLRHDWIFLFVASVCFAKKRWYLLSGAALTWSALLRVFPAVAGFAWGVMILLYLIKHRRFHPDHLRFVAGALIAGTVLVPSSLYVAGPTSYGDFAHHIALHKNTPLTNHMGLEVILAHEWDERMYFTRDDSLDDPFKTWKEERLDANRAVLYGSWIAIMLWIFWAVHRLRSFWVGAPLCIPLVMSMTNLTCYYMVIFIAFAPLVRLRPSLGPALLATAAASQVLLKHFYWIDDRYTALSYLFFAFALMPLIAFSRPVNASNWRHLIDSVTGRKTRPEPTPATAAASSEA